MDLDYCLLTIFERWLLSSLKRAWLMILSMEEILHQLIWRIFPFFPLGFTYIYIYISIYICIYISTGIRFPPSTVGLPFVQLKVIDANLRSLSALYLDPFLWKTSNPPTQPPCLPWHKMAHGDDIRPHLLLKQPTADLLRTIKLSSPLYVDAIFQRK